MSDLEQALTWHPELSDQLPKGFLQPDGYGDIDDDLILDDGPVAGLVSIRYIWAAVRRRFRLWGTLGVIGLLLGAGVYVTIPPAHQAVTTVLLVDSPAQDPLQEIQIDTALASSTVVAKGIVSELGLRMTPSKVLTKYTVTEVTSHAVTITASAAASDDAVRLSAAAATQFLKYRAAYAQTQQQQTEKQLNQQVAQAQHHLDSITNKIAHVSSRAGTPEQQAQLKTLQAQQVAATNSLGQVQQYASQAVESTRISTQTMVLGSRVLNDATPVKRSVVKTVGFYAIVGLLGGLALGIVIVIVAAVTSDRLRRRDDIARAFGAPVGLSVGPLRPGRWSLPGRRRQAVTRRRDRERVVEFLRHAVPEISGRQAGLAVVAVDDVPAVAEAVVALAASSAARGKRVALADLSADARAARLLGVGTGSSQVSRAGASFRVVVPPRNDVAPTGPLDATAPHEGNAPANRSLAVACAGADLVLTMATLDPAFGADHLVTWATDVVAVITVGRSTGVRINAVGEMLRLAGMRRSTVIVVGADKGDESLGAVSAIYSAASL